MRNLVLTEKIFVTEKLSVGSRHQRSVADWLALVIATGGGAGFVPIVPATWGSAVGVGVYLLAQKAGESLAIWAQVQNVSAEALVAARISAALIFLIALFLIGIWAATRVVELTGAKDPRIVVVDEIVGQLVTLMLIPARLGWWMLALGFFAFRLFDIWKPYPANELESLPKGLGVMADDVAAGFYAAALIWLIYAASQMIL